MSNLHSRLISVISQKRDLGLSLQKERHPSCFFTKAPWNVTLTMRQFEKKFWKHIISYETKIQVFDCTCLLSLPAQESTFHGNSWMHHRKGKSAKVSMTAMSLKVKNNNITPLIRVAICSDFCFHVLVFELKFWLAEKRGIQNASRFPICALASCALHVSEFWHIRDIMLTMRRLHGLSATISFHEFPEETMGALPYIFHFPTAQKSKPYATKVFSRSNNCCSPELRVKLVYSCLLVHKHLIQGANKPLWTWKLQWPWSRPLYVLVYRVLSRSFIWELITKKKSLGLNLISHITTEWAYNPSLIIVKSSSEHP